MATDKAPTKADFLAALEKKGIKSLEDLIDAVMPEPDETGGYGTTYAGFQGQFDYELWDSTGSSQFSHWMMSPPDVIFHPENEIR